MPDNNNIWETYHLSDWQKVLIGIIIGIIVLYLIIKK